MRVPLPKQMQVLHNRNFRLYWLGQLVSLTGTWMQVVAQSIVVLALTHNSVAALGVVNLAFTLPTLLLMLTGGVVADRWDRRRIMIATQATLMAFAFVMALLLATGTLTLPLLLVMSTLAGVATAYDMPAQQALVPDLVTPPEIPQAIAMNQIIFNGSRLLGPAVAGVALVTVSPATMYFLNGISFLAVIASLRVIRVHAGNRRPTPHGSMLQSLREGLGYVRRSRLLRGLFAVVALAVFLVFPALAVLLPGYIKQALHRGPGTIGLLMAMSGGASMLGAFGLLWVPARRRGHVMVGGVLMMGLALAALGLWHGLWTAALATGALSLGFSLYTGLNATTVQQSVPGMLRGRVMSVSAMMFSGVMPFAALFMGFAVARSGFTHVYLAGAAAFVVGAIPLMLSSGVMGYEPPEQPAHHGPPHAPAREPAAMSAE